MFFFITPHRCVKKGLQYSTPPHLGQVAVQLRQGQQPSSQQRLHCLLVVLALIVHGQPGRGHVQDHALAAQDLHLREFGQAGMCTQCDKTQRLLSMCQCP
eukprot:1158130-Pelagomonas_calceolata.AAC.11